MMKGEEHREISICYPALKGMCEEMPQKRDEEQQQGKSFLSPQLMVYGGVGACFLSLVITFGDLIDIIAYVALWLVLSRFAQRLLTPFKGREVANAALWFSSHLIFFGSLNRVHGYPDKELIPLLQFLCIGFLWVVIFVLLFFYYRQRRVLLVCVAMLLLPIIEGPVFLMRQLTAHVVMVRS